jgi:hypothetical protein
MVKKRVLQMVDFTLYTYKKKKKKKKKKRESVCVLVTLWSLDVVLGTRFLKNLGSQPNNTKSSAHLTSRVCHS